MVWYSCCCLSTSLPPTKKLGSSQSIFPFAPHQCATCHPEYSPSEETFWNWLCLLRAEDMALLDSHQLCAPCPTRLYSCGGVNQSFFRTILPVDISQNTRNWMRFQLEMVVFFLSRKHHLKGTILVKESRMDWNWQILNLTQLQVGHKLTLLQLKGCHHPHTPTMPAWRPQAQFQATHATKQWNSFDPVLQFN